jgi:putative ABC transport system substrate-binding protein
MLFFRWLMIKRVAFLLGVLGLSGGFVGAETILVVQTMPVPAIEHHRAAFLDTLSTMIPAGRHEIVEFQANGDYQRAVDFFQKQNATERPSLVVTFATLATQAAVSVYGPDSGVPILFAVVVDPVGAGIVTEVGVPSGSNVAGIVYTVDRRVKIATALDILATGLGFDSVTVGVPHSSYPSSRDDAASLRRAAESFPKIEFLEGEFDYAPVPDGIPVMREQMASVIRDLESRVDWWWEATGPMGERPESVSDILIASDRSVLFAIHSDGVADGGLFSISPDPLASGQKLAGMAREILDGAAPGSYPGSTCTGEAVPSNHSGCHRRSRSSLGRARDNLGG